ncbi:MAG TPA: DUF4231 domain-containing protein [Cyanothece sp. UBA12306]|nr:DUF4231 domain-containing protein [Cyanothece sp. UBA12306]
MTDTVSSQVTNAEEQANQVKKSSPQSGDRRFFKVLEYLALDGFLASLVLTFFFLDNKILITLDAAFLASFVFLALFNGQYFSYGDRIRKDEKNAILLEQTPGTKQRIKLERDNALNYCQQLIDDYSKTRKNARNFYYILQLATIIFSGVTPVLVLVDKLDIGAEWINWLPVIFPAVASILASVGTSFPLENQWKTANNIVENLEAEQQKFILGITQDNVLDLPDKTSETRQKRAIVNFVNKVNEIHLQQVQAQAQIEEAKEEELEEEES